MLVRHRAGEIGMFGMGSGARHVGVGAMTAALVAGAMWAALAPTPWERRRREPSTSTSAPPEAGSTPPKPRSSISQTRQGVPSSGCLSRSRAQRSPRARRTPMASERVALRSSNGRPAAGPTRPSPPSSCASGGAAGDSFGRLIAFDGDTLLAAGSPAETVEVFPRPPGGWVSGTETATLTRSDGDAITPIRPRGVRRPCRHHLAHGGPG